MADSEDSGDYIIALLSHDISNFNQTSRGYLEMLLADQLGPLTPDQARAMAICLRQTGRVQNLIDSVRMLVRLHQSPVHLVPVDLDQAIRDAILQAETDYAEREVRVSFQAAGRQALAEPQLELVFRHLVANAVQHNDSEVVEVQVRVSEELGPDEAPQWRVLVADNGDGIPPTRRQGLFQRLDSRDVHGSGMGLCLVKRLLERWGGDVWLESSDQDRGTVIGLTLQRCEVD